MRMWMIDPRLLCRKHLLGEHGELHKFRHCFVKQFSITRRIEKDQIEPRSMKARHDDLAAEMLRRGYQHKSPYQQPDLSYLPVEEREHEVDRADAQADLMERCLECRELFKEEGEMADELTDEHLLDLYSRVWREQVDPDIRGELLLELRALLSAKTQLEAIDVVKWWDPFQMLRWGDTFQLRAQAIADINEFRQSVGVEPLLPEEEKWTRHLEDIILRLCGTAPDVCPAADEETIKIAVDAVEEIKRRRREGD